MKVEIEIPDGKYCDECVFAKKYSDGHADRTFCKYYNEGLNTHWSTYSGTIMEKCKKCMDAIRNSK